MKKERARGRTSREKATENPHKLLSVDKNVIAKHKTALETPEDLTFEGSKCRKEWKFFDGKKRKRERGIKSAMRQNRFLVCKNTKPSFLRLC
jgi:hypothetical protein